MVSFFAVLLAFIAGVVNLAHCPEDSCPIWNCATMGNHICGE